MKLPFINDKCLHKVNKVLVKYELPVKQISITGQKLKNLSKNKQHNNCNCKICNQLGGKFHCNNRFVVYEFTCNTCCKNYIGETCVHIKDRYQQHSKSVENKDGKSALSAHMISDHSELDHNISNFKLKILSIHKDSLDTALSESIAIQKLKPTLNRKFELNSYNLCM